MLRQHWFALVVQKDYKSREQQPVQQSEGFWSPTALCVSLLRKGLPRVQPVAPPQVWKLLAAD